MDAILDSEELEAAVEEILRARKGDAVDCEDSGQRPEQKAICDAALVHVLSLGEKKFVYSGLKSYLLDRFGPDMFDSFKIKILSFLFREGVAAVPEEALEADLITESVHCLTGGMKRERISWKTLKKELVGIYGNACFARHQLHVRSMLAAPESILHDDGRNRGEDKRLEDIEEVLAALEVETDADSLLHKLQDRLACEVARQASCAALVDSVCFDDVSLSRGTSGKSPEGSLQIESEIRALEREHRYNLQIERGLERREKELVRLENQSESQANNLENEMRAQQELFNSALTLALSTERRLSKMLSLNVLSDAFWIDCSGELGTINGFRLGQKSGSAALKWDEVNAAFGQAALLLSTIASLMSYSFRTYRVVPQGSYSKMVKIGDERSNTHCLYYSDGGLINGPWNNWSFNSAQHAFLLCVRELGEYTQVYEARRRRRLQRNVEEEAYLYGSSKAVQPAWENSLQQHPGLPYRIQGNIIGGYVLRFGSNEDNWNTALKFVLADLKTLVAWISLQKAEKQKSERISQEHYNSVMTYESGAATVVRTETRFSPSGSAVAITTELIGGS